MTSKPDRLADHLRHIVEAIDRSTVHVDGMSSSEDLEKDPKTVDAVVRCVEVIGEATARITQATPEFVARHQDVPWEGMIAMRSKVVHDFEVDYGAVWQTVEADMPPLRAQLVKLLYSLSRDSR